MFYDFQLSQFHYNLRDILLQQYVRRNLEYYLPFDFLAHIFYLQPVASTINTLAGALYKVFCASPDQARKEMRDACFDYLSLGGVFSTGPVSLLSGLNPRPLSLVCHFFAVAIYGVGRLLLPFPSPKRMWIGARLISVGFNLAFLHLIFGVFTCFCMT